MKIRIGIFFGGNSREREVSFAGGRTVYDNLNKSLFEAVPIFVDSFNNFVLLDWHFIYKGSIRDFYPPVDQLPDSPNEFQVYAESLGKPDRELQDRLIREIGKKVLPDQLNELIDFAFLCLHGPFGEDGRIQGLLEFYGIPYSGSGILSSAIGINKAIQKSLMHEAGFPGPANFSIRRSEWAEPMTAGGIITKIRDEIGYPCVVKPANQGSSIGVTILSAEDPARLAEAIELAFFRQRISQEEWKGWTTTTSLLNSVHSVTSAKGSVCPSVVPRVLNAPYSITRKIYCDSWITASRVEPSRYSSKAWMPTPKCW